MSDDRSLWEQLRAPFNPDDLDWKVQSVSFAKRKALVLTYMTTRAIMDRLDDVIGPPNWRDEYTRAPEGGILCGISIRVGDEWVTKWDGAPNTDRESVKGGLSSALKRAAVRWGIGRYLYRLPTDWHPVKDGWANGNGIDVSARDPKASRDSRPEHIGWIPFPALPSWARPGGSGRPTSSASPPARRQEPEPPQESATVQSARDRLAEVGCESQGDADALCRMLSKGKGGEVLCNGFGAAVADDDAAQAVLDGLARALRDGVPPATILATARKDYADAAR